VRPPGQGAGGPGGSAQGRAPEAQGKDALKAEFETERSKWAEKEAFFTDGYGEIEDMIDGKSLLLSNGCRLLQESASGL
jgi:hypothetical protein